jgi:glucose/arabinose dehydrogenase
MASAHLRQLGLSLALFGGFVGSVVADLDLTTTLVVSGLVNPIGLVSAHDGSGRLFIVEKAGQIRVWDGDELLEDDFLDVSTGSFDDNGERGLLGLAFHPDYPADNRFFVFYTLGNGDLRIAGYTVSGDPDVANGGSAMELLTIPHSSASNHNGGQLAFGLDGYLYISVGDGGNTPGAARDLTDNLLGKILRLDIDVDPEDYLPGDPPAYEIPEGPPANPFVGETGDDEIWDYGLRNPWRFSFDRETGDLWIGDVGQQDTEEIDYEPAPSAGGVDWGWNVMEGDQCYPPGTNCTPVGTFPVLTYESNSGPCAVTGGFVYRGDLHPRLRGSYLFADYCTGEIFGTVQRCDAVWEAVELVDAPFNIPSFGEGEDGELYVTTGGSGAVHRLGLAGSASGADVEAAPGSRDFGAVAANTLVTQEIVLQNVNFGDEAAVVAGIDLSGGAPFAVNPAGGADPCGTLTPCLAPGESCTVLAELSSATGGAFGDTLEVDGNFAAAAVSLEGVVYESCNLDGVSLALTTAVTGTVSACEDITAGSGFVVEAAAAATLRAGNFVAFDNGASVAGTLSVEVDPLIALES